MPTRILQLTDLHLFAEPDAVLKGVAMRDSLSRVLDFVESSGERFDYVVITGDLTHDGHADSYQAVRSLLDGRFASIHVIPGNHDDRAALRRVFPQPAASPREFIAFSLEAAGWRLIGLDTLAPGHGFGRIATPQLDWLRGELTRSAQQPTVLLMHHPPVAVGSAWLDAIGLAERDAFCEMIVAAPQVALVCCGHVHQEFDGALGRVRVVATPSTGVQFVPRSEQLVVESVGPGYRVIELDGRACRTHVVRVPAAV